MTKTLAIVGGGPKAAALAARAATLKQLGVANVPDLLVFEKARIGAAWSGGSGYSSGYLTLCSPAEKDVGFPYAEAFPSLGGKAVAPALYASFSWSAYLVTTGRFSEWVDRGRDHPTHRDWADYLRWVFEQANQDIIKAEVLDVTPQAMGGWHIRYRDEEGEDTTFADGVVLTGAGKAKVIPGLSEEIPDGKVFDAESFWDSRDKVLAMSEIAVTGGGGAAGAIIAWLSNALAERQDAAIHSISSMGTLFPRGDGYAERRWFSDPSDWRELNVGDRRRLLAHTEAGVISSRNKATIDSARNVSYVQGHARDAEWDEDELKIGLTYDGHPRPPLKAHCLINAIGFDNWSLLEYVETRTAKDILTRWSAGERDDLQEKMADDLSFPPEVGLGTGLHIPTLAALAHGPGMATLGSLGLLASAILDGYL